MLTRWRDQADLVIWNVWNSPVLAIIARRILSKISIVPNESRQGTYDFDTGEDSGLSFSASPSVALSWKVDEA